MVNHQPATCVFFCLVGLNRERQRWPVNDDPSDEKGVCLPLTNHLDMGELPIGGGACWISKMNHLSWDQFFKLSRLNLGNGRILMDNWVNADHLWVLWTMTDYDSLVIVIPGRLQTFSRIKHPTLESERFVRCSSDEIPIVHILRCSRGTSFVNFVYLHFNEA